MSDHGTNAPWCIRCRRAMAWNYYTSRHPWGVEFWECRAWGCRNAIIVRVYLHALPGAA